MRRKIKHIFLAAQVSFLLVATAHGEVLKTPIAIGKCTAQYLEQLKKTPRATSVSKPLPLSQTMILTKYLYSYLAVIESHDLILKKAAPLEPSENPNLATTVLLSMALGEHTAAMNLEKAYADLEPCAVEAARILKSYQDIERKKK